MAEHKKAHVAIENAKAMEVEGIILTDTKAKYSVVVTMRIERFFTSLLESYLHLSKDSRKMLEDEEFVNFFMTCGPTYVRSLQRAQEVTAIITFEAEDKYIAQDFAASLRLYVFGNRGRAMQDSHGQQMPSDLYGGFDMDLDFDDSEIRKSLSIEILGYGLGLNKIGSETLVAASLNEFNQVMRYAFNSMTKTTNVQDVQQQQAGMVYGMEVVPFTDNSEFLAVADVDYNRILAPVPRVLIEDARNGDMPCLSSDSETDDYGKCCDPLDKVEVAQVNAFGTTSMKSKCAPQQYLSPVVMKENLETNAEFVSWLTSVAREKLKNLSTLGQCVNKLRALPERYDYMFLHSNDKASYDQSIEMSFTVKELKAVLDPSANLEILSLLRTENDEYLEMFYQPCLSALYGKNAGADDPKFIMAEPWYNLKECSRASCLESNMAWDRLNGEGCVPGILSREMSIDSTIPYCDDVNCAKKIDPESGEETCKYNYFPQNRNMMKQIDTCREAMPRGRDGRGRSVDLSISYLMEYFCMPKVALDRDEANFLKMDEVDASWDICVSFIHFLKVSKTYFIYIFLNMGDTI